MQKKLYLEVEMGNIPAKITGKYQSYDINTPSHITPPILTSTKSSPHQHHFSSSIYESESTASPAHFQSANSTILYQNNQKNEEDEMVSGGDEVVAPPVRNSSPIDRITVDPAASELDDDDEHFEERESPVDVHIDDEHNHHDIEESVVMENHSAGLNSQGASNDESVEDADDEDHIIESHIIDNHNLLDRSYFEQPQPILAD